MRHAHSAHESALTPACRTASLPSSMLKSSGRLQHQSALRSPFENAVEGSGATPSLPDACALAVTMEPTTEATSRDLELTLCWPLPLAVVISPISRGRRLCCGALCRCTTQPCGAHEISACWSVLCALVIFGCKHNACSTFIAAFPCRPKPTELTNLTTCLYCC